LDALAHHPDPDIHGEAISLLGEVARVEAEPSLTRFARLDAEVLHARLFASAGNRGLFRAVHSTARRLYAGKLRGAGPCSGKT
jgi:hypothetical protein